MQLRCQVNGRCLLRISGVVQGVGFRPFLWRRARRLGLAGWCENDPGGVTVEVTGPQAAVEAFLDGLADDAPPLAVVDQISVVAEGSGDELPADGGADFVIQPSRQGEPRGAVVPADSGSCAACLVEVADPNDRRYRYPFTNCIDCGPRYTIIESLPYDRASTTMRAFTMCPACAAEYADATSRRFHAQPNACPVCGPQVWFVRREADGESVDSNRVAGEAAIAAAREVLAAGGILGVKGLGGFHLACDAMGPTVAELRRRKHREGKPLAVLCESVAAAERFAVVSEQERRLLESRERPIVLVRKRSQSGLLAAEVAPDNDFVGVMLPCLPLQQQLAAGMPPLVMTSGNLSEEPIAWQNHQAVTKLEPLVDGLLLHDREIVIPCDDSVVRSVAGAVLPIRRSRGFAPLPIRLPVGGSSILAVGGELKAAVCLTRGEQAFLSQHIGDVGNVEALAVLEATVEHLCRLFAVRPEVVVADLHPGYLSATWAAAYAERQGVPLLRVQHHEAHAAALLGEHGHVIDGEERLAVACFDGTGYGWDGSIWGGEAFVSGREGLTRVATLASFALPGGDACIRQPWRTALAVLHAAGIDWDERLPCVAAGVAAAGANGQRVLRRQLETSLNCNATSSMGRLFDAVASILGLKQEVTYEAEAALRLETLAGEVSRTPRRYRFTIDKTGPLPWQIGWHGVISAIVADTLAGESVAGIAAGFHEAVAELLVELAGQLQACGLADGGLGLSGGVFQNARLVERACERLQASGHEVLLHHQVPANDGGLAYGQAVLAGLPSASRRLAR
jgi:hydrogenase maturation protein HypF